MRCTILLFIAILTIFQKVALSGSALTPTIPEGYVDDSHDSYVYRNERGNGRKRRRLSRQKRRIHTSWHLTGPFLVDHCCSSGQFYVPTVGLGIFAIYKSLRHCHLIFRDTGATTSRTEMSTAPAGGQHCRWSWYRNAFFSLCRCCFCRRLRSRLIPPLLSTLYRPKYHIFYWSVGRSAVGDWCPTPKVSRNIQCW